MLLLWENTSDDSYEKKANKAQSAAEEFPRSKKETKHIPVESDLMWCCGRSLWEVRYLNFERRNLSSLLVGILSESQKRNDESKIFSVHVRVCDQEKLFKLFCLASCSLRICNKTPSPDCLHSATSSIEQCFRSSACSLSYLTRWLLNDEAVEDKKERKIDQFSESVQAAIWK